MDSLPGEIILNILSRLPIKPLIRCKSVCKSFLNLTLDPYFINTHLNNASHHQNLSLILNSTILNGTTDFRSLLYCTNLTQTQSNSSCDQIPFSPLHFDEFCVVGSCNGLLCLTHRKISGFLFVINPCTGKRIEIPKLKKPLLGVGIGFCPKSNEYKLVTVIRGSDSSYVFSLSEGVWRAVGAPSFKISGYLKLKTVCVNGVIHWTSSSRSNFMVCFDVVDEVFDVIPYPAGGLQQGEVALALFSGCLGVIKYEENNCLDIWVMKEYNVSESWTRSFIINMNHIGWTCRDVEVLYVHKNGDVLVLHKNQTLWFYDPKTRSFKKHYIVGLPSWFIAVCHVGSLVSPGYCEGTGNRRVVKLGPLSEQLKGFCLKDVANNSDCSSFFFSSMKISLNIAIKIPRFPKKYGRYGTIRRPLQTKDRK